MSKCSLCKKLPADKKGSHIVPHFLLKRIENVAGKKGRDYELGFNIQEFVTESHFGSAVQTDKLDEVYGEIEDEEIKNFKSSLIVDYVFCTKCELRLSKIESEYALTLNKFKAVDYESGLSSELGILFWLSVLWRMSINKKSGVQLSKFESETARRILNRCLTEDIKKIDIAHMQQSVDLKKVCYRIFRCPNYSETNPTLLFLHPKFQKPYVLLIDEFILLFSFKNNFTEFSFKDYMGIKYPVFNKKSNVVNSNEFVFLLDGDILKSINSEIISTMKFKRMKKLNEFFDKLHRALNGNGSKMPEEIRIKIIAEITSNEKKLGRKYTLEDLRNSTVKVLQEYGPVSDELIEKQKLFYSQIS